MLKLSKPRETEPKKMGLSTGVGKGSDVGLKGIRRLGNHERPKRGSVGKCALWHEKKV